MPEGADIKRSVLLHGTRGLLPPRRRLDQSQVLRLVALIAMVASLGAVAMFTPWLTERRQRAVNGEREAMAVQRTVDAAALAVARLRLSLDRTDQASIRRQLADLAALVTLNPVEETAELQALRDLLANALPPLRAAVAMQTAGQVGPLRSGLTQLSEDISEMSRASERLVEQKGEARVATDSAMPLVNLFTICVVLTALLFLAAVLYRDHALRLAHQELAAWGREMAALTSAMPGVLIRMRKAPTGRWFRSFVADSVVALTGHSVEEALAPGWLRRQLEPPTAPLFAALERALAGTEQVVLLQFRRKDGRWIWLRVLMKAHEARDGEGEVLSTWSDVTRECDLARRAEHGARLAQLGEVATRMAHELNQPLAGISLAAENAQRILDRLPDPQLRLQAKLELIVSLALRAAGIIDRMRVFGRAAEGANEPVQLEQVLDSALVLMRGRTEQSNVTMICDLPPGLPPALGKPVPLELALTNLMLNACDAYDALPDPPAPDLRRIEIAAKVQRDHLVLTVRDRAGGVPPAIMPRIFEPFFTTKPVGQAQGLGLSVSYGILSDMGGTLTAAPLEGGTEFALTLPLAQQA